MIKGMVRSLKNAKARQVLTSRTFYNNSSLSTRLTLQSLSQYSSCDKHVPKVKLDYFLYILMSTGSNNSFNNKILFSLKCSAFFLPLAFIFLLSLSQILILSIQRLPHLPPLRRRHRLRRVSSRHKTPSRQHMLLGDAVLWQDGTRRCGRRCISRRIIKMVYFKYYLN